MKKIVSYIIGIIWIIVPILIWVYIYQNMVESKNLSNSTNQTTNSGLQINRWLETENIYIWYNQRKVELAKTDEQRMIWLMNRDNLDEDGWMLFLREDDLIRNFWMKDTRIPLDIIYINSDLKIVKIWHGSPYDLTAISSEVPARYVLELNGWQAIQYNIAVWDKVKIWK